MLLTCLLSLALAVQLTAQSSTQKTWCSDLYVGDIRVPQEQRFYFFRRLIRNNIAAILKDIDGCSIIERNKGLESLLEREREFFNDSTYDKIIDYTDQFKRKIRWVVLGELSPTMEPNEYELEVRIIRAASRVSDRGFVYTFPINEDFDQKTFNKDFRLRFLEEMDQMFTFNGYVNSQSNITGRNFRIIPAPEDNSLSLDSETGSFEFKIPKYKFEHDTLSVEILGRNIYGTLGASPAIDHTTSSNTVRLNRIDVGRTTGQVIDLIWDKKPAQCDDFRVHGLTLFSRSTFSHRDSVYIYKTDRGFRFNLPKGLPDDTEVQVDIISENYKQYLNPGKFPLDLPPPELMAGTYSPPVLRKLVPGLHQVITGNWGLAAGIWAAGGYGLYQYDQKKGAQRSLELQASRSGSSQSREELYDLAAKEKSKANLYLKAVGLIYIGQLLHAFHVRKCRRFSKDRKNYGFIMPSYQHGVFGLSLKLSF